MLERITRKRHKYRHRLQVLRDEPLGWVLPSCLRRDPWLEGYLEVANHQHLINALTLAVCLAHREGALSPDEAESQYLVAYDYLYS